MDLCHCAIGEIHVWRAALDLDPAMLRRLAMTLSSDEKQRASNFYFNRDRERFIAGRGFLRDILSRYTNSRPADLQFVYNDYGKPEFREPGRVDAIRFNLSHSNGTAVFAVSREREIGIDIETLRDDLSILEVAASFFSRAEVLSLNALPAQLRCQAFYRCWVRKEAYVKARGMGLSVPLDSFDVSLNPGSSAALLASTEPSDVLNWGLKDLVVADGYIGAVAAEGNDWTVRQYDWDAARAPRTEEAL